MEGSYARKTYNMEVLAYSFFSPNEFINEGAAPPAFSAEEDEVDVEESERRVRERYSSPNHTPYVENGKDVQQQALLPTLSDPKLFLVKCKIGHERESAIRLMQRVVQKKAQHIFSVAALDHLQNYVYVEAEMQAHVKEAIVGLQNIYFSHEPEVIPIEEMCSVLSVDNKIVDIAKGSWVRMRRGDYQRDLAQETLAFKASELYRKHGGEGGWTFLRTGKAQGTLRHR